MCDLNGGAPFIGVGAGVSGPGRGEVPRPLSRWRPGKVEWLPEATAQADAKAVPFTL